MGPGDLIRAHRKRRRLSQLELAGRAGISARHLSYVERGRSRPGRAVVAALARAMALPLGEANRIARAAGLPAIHPEHGLEDPEVETLRNALEVMLAAHMPLPAVVTDHSWRVVRGNLAFGALAGYLARHTQRPPGAGSLLEWLFAPDGLRPLVLNWDAVSALLLERARHEAVLHPDLDKLVARLETLAHHAGGPPDHSLHEYRVVLPLHLSAGGRELRLFSVLARFGSALDANMECLRFEYFFPEDAASRAELARICASASGEAPAPIRAEERCEGS